MTSKCRWPIRILLSRAPTAGLSRRGCGRRQPMHNIAFQSRSTYARGRTRGNASCDAIIADIVGLSMRGKRCTLAEAYC